MGRRRLVVLWSAVLMLAIGAALVGAFVVATQGEGGRDLIRRVVEAQLDRVTQGRVHLGTLSGSFITDLAIDSLEIRGPDDSLFAATGPLRVTFDPRDLMDGRLFIRSVEATRPRVTMRRGFDGDWNIERLWPRRPRTGPRRPRPRSAFGSVLVLEQVAVRDGDFAVTMPWAPADTLRGDAREAAIAAKLADPRSEAQRVGRRFTHTYRWRGIRADLPRIRLSYPDSLGRAFELARLDATETNPPFAFREVRGTVRWLGDSIWFDVPGFRLPGSAGRAEGKVWWGGGRPTRYRVHVEGDTVALADVAWISPALPTEGQGTMALDIRNAPGARDALEYAISGMDVRAHRSRVRGRMTWVIGGPVAVLKDVDLEAAPVDFALIERFNQGPFAYPFAGRITGRLRGRGGPLDRFRVDDLAVRWADGNVPGAVARGRAQGELDILDPANTRFRGFRVTLDTFDLRTPQALNPDFPRLAGTIAGTAVLDSSWLDVRFSEADLVHRDGDHPESRFTGRGRLTTGEVAMAYDVDLEAMPLAFTTLARSFPGVPLRGDFAGPLRASGTLADLLLQTDLEGEAGRLTADVRLDGEAPGYRVRGTARMTAVDPRLALADTLVPSGELTGRAELDVAGDSLANLDGRAAVSVERSTLAGIRIFTGEGRLRFADGRLLVDTLGVETTALALRAAGALGLHEGRTDSLQFVVRADSLGGFRRWLTTAATDSLAGGVDLTGIVTGWVRGFALDAALEGAGLVAGVGAVRLLTGSAELTGLPSAATGTLALAADTLRAAGFVADRLFARATLDGQGAAVVDVDLAGPTGTRADGRALVGREGDTIRVVLDSLAVRTQRQRWALAAPAAFVAGAPGFSVDSLVLRGQQGAALRLSGAVPREGALGLAFSARGVPVADLAELLQVPGEQAGAFELDARLTGTRAAPALEARGTLRGGLVRGVRLDTLVAAATADADALRFTAALGPGARPVLRAEGSLPLRLGLDGDGPAMQEDGPVRATVRGDTVSLRLFDAITQRTSGDPGTFGLDLRVGGTWREPRLEGGLLVRDGNIVPTPLGDVRWRRLNADIGLVGDSIAVRRLTAESTSGGRTGRASLAGWVTIADLENPSFDLTARANTFHVYNVRNVADIDLSDSLRISGSLKAATLRGALTADRAVIAIPEIATKDVISLTEFDRFGVVDTTALLDRRLAPQPPSVFVENLTVRNVPIRMGRDVWLRSAEANINLGGQVAITRAQARRGAGGEAQLALTGSLQTVRGTYRLNLGPVQRTFEVERGSIDWFGEPEYVFDPSLDIAALYTVRQYSKQGAQPDVRVRVNIGGTLLQPTAALSTPDSARVRNADLISYLVTGGPSFEIGGRNTNYTSTAARVLISSLGSVLGGKAGGLCDDARLSTSGIDEGGGRTLTSGTAAVLEGTRFNCGKQVGERAFVRLDAGLCQVGQFVQDGAGSLNASAFANSIGVKLDYLLRGGYTISAGVEPPTNALLCTQNLNARGFVPTPQQFGFDLFRAWRF